MTNTAAVTPATFEKNLSATNDEFDGKCEEFASSIFWPVLLTLIAVFVAESMFYIFWKYYWKIRYGKHLVLVKDVEKGDAQFAFDNPGFREGTPLTKTKKISTDTKENADRQKKITNGHRPKMSEAKTTNMSNSVATERETNVVSLRGRDFTGLGFSICGNKRDGIFVRDVSHHGPASETGRIKAGDRILAVRINFNENIDLKDATDILCSASPYKIEIEIEDGSMSPNSLKNGGASNCIVHTVFRNSTQQIQKIIPRNSENRAISNNYSPVMTKPAILQVSETSAKRNRLDVEVIPDIKEHSQNPTIFNSVSLPLVYIEKQQKTLEAYNDSGIDLRIQRPSSLDEVDLSLSTNSLSPNEKSPSFLPIVSKEQHSVKKTLAKGIHNLKEKLNNHIHKSANKENKHIVKNNNQTDNTTIFNSLNSDYKSKIRMAEFTRNAEISMVANTSKCASFDPNDSENYGRKHNSAKPRAPLPPSKHRTFESLGNSKNDRNGEDRYIILNKNEDQVDENKDNFGDDKADSTSTITKPDLSYVIVHHIAEDMSNRKATSLSDLSTIDKPTESTASLGLPLERAVSLELTENPAPKMCYINEPKKQIPSIFLHEEGFVAALPEATLFLQESDFEINSNSKLKKSSLFGTLEEAMGKNDTREHDDDNAGKLSSSLQMKSQQSSNSSTTSEDDNDKNNNIFSPVVATDKYELYFSNVTNVNDGQSLENDDILRVPSLPTSPPPYADTVEVSGSNIEMEDGCEKIETNSSTSMTTFTKNGVLDNNQDSENITSITKPLNDELKLSSPKYEESNFTFDIDTSIEREAAEMYISLTNDENFPIELSQEYSREFLKENLSDEQILAMNSSSSTPTTAKVTSARYRFNNDGPTSPKKPIPRCPTSSRFLKLNQFPSPTKTINSRIPVRSNTEPSLKVQNIISSSNKE